MKTEPTNQNVLVRPLKLVSKSKIPVANEQKQEIGVIVASEPDSKYKVGDKYFFKDYGYDTVLIDGETLYVMKEENLSLKIIKE